jgi:hypothetical protein
MESSQHVLNRPLSQSSHLHLITGVYATIGTNGALVAEPGVLHFGGFEPGKRHTQVLRIVNRSPVSQRLHIIPPSTPHFKATCDKKGTLAPGMCEEIVVEFLPEQLRYYHETLKIHCEPDNLLIPIHAYPVMNETKFPSRIDFGKCPVGKPVTKKVKIECKVPMEFEFQIKEVKSNPSFSISPMSGSIPAHGHTVVEICFTPTLHRTEEMSIEVRVSEFNSKPVVCAITGSSMPGLNKDRELNQALLKTTATLAPLSTTARSNALLMSKSTAKSRKGGEDEEEEEGEEGAVGVEEVTLKGPLGKQMNPKHPDPSHYVIRCLTRLLLFPLFFLITRYGGS